MGMAFGIQDLAGRHQELNRWGSEASQGSGLGESYLSVAQ